MNAGIIRAILALSATTLVSCDKFPLLSGPSDRVPTQLDVDIGSTPLYSGESTPVVWRVFDQNGVAFDNLPHWVEPQLEGNETIFRFHHDRIEALKPGQASFTLAFAGLRATESVRVNPGALKVNVTNAYITQGIQRLDGTVPLVAGRAGLLRVFVTGDQINFFRPSVRVRFYRNGLVIAEMASQAGDEGVPLKLAEGTLSRSWNFQVPAELVAPGVSFLVDVLTDSFLRPAQASVMRFPASGVARPLDARVVAPFRITFVPIHINNFATGNVTPANVDYYMGQVRAVWPLNVTDVVVREPYSTNTRSLTDEDWSDLLREIQLLRLADNSTRYYHGILKREGAWAGLGYIAYPVAITQDGNSEWTVAHELGHNFGRRHAPCGSPSGVDTGFPYTNGGIGVYGLATDGVTLYPPTRADLMTYCSPRWISDYSFVGALAFRQANPGLDAAAGPAVSMLNGTMLMVSGRIGSAGAQLDPAFTITTAAALPAAPGPYTVEGHDANGANIFSISFAGEAMGDGPEDARQFAYAIPIATGEAARLARISLSGAGQRVDVASATMPLAADIAQSVNVARGSNGIVNLQWNATRYPLLVVRNPATGAVLSLARGGSAAIRTATNDLELSVSDGVRTVIMRVTPRQ